MSTNRVSHQVLNDAELLQLIRAVSHELDRVIYRMTTPMQVLDIDGTPTLFVARTVTGTVPNVLDAVVECLDKIEGPVALHTVEVTTGDRIMICYGVPQ